jgi:hypothetical protein
LNSYDGIRFFDLPIRLIVAVTGLNNGEMVRKAKSEPQKSGLYHARTRHKPRELVKRSKNLEAATVSS